MRQRLNVLLVAALSLPALTAAADSPAEPVSIDTVHRVVSFRAVYRPDQFNHGRGLHNHHLMTWAGGGAARNALLVALSPDSAIHDALVSVGAVPGNNLSADAWEKIDDSRSTAPDMHAAGTLLRIDIVAHGRTISVDSILRDNGGRRFDFCFAGNRALINRWHSGCVVCLESCPGSKISNRTYAMRDLARGSARFSERPTAAIARGDTVLVRVRQR